MRGRSVCPWKDSSISPATSVTSSSVSWTKLAQTCPGGSVHTVQLNPRLAHACCMCDGSMVFSSQDHRCASYTVTLSSNPLGLLLENSVPDTTGLLHPLCHAGRL